MGRFKDLLKRINESPSRFTQGDPLRIEKKLKKALPEKSFIRRKGKELIPKIEEGLTETGEVVRDRFRTFLSAPTEEKKEIFVRGAQEVGRAVPQIAKAVGQEMLAGLATFAKSGVDLFGDFDPEKQAELADLETKLFGRQIKTFQQIATETKETLEEQEALPFEQKSLPILAVAGSIFVESPFGLPEKSFFKTAAKGLDGAIAKAIAKETSTEAIEALIKKEMKDLPEELVQRASRILKDVDDPKRISDTMQAIAKEAKLNTHDRVIKSLAKSKSTNKITNTLDRFGIKYTDETVQAIKSTDTVEDVMRALRGTVDDLTKPIKKTESSFNDLLRFADELDDGAQKQAVQRYLDGIERKVTDLQVYDPKGSLVKQPDGSFIRQKEVVANFVPEELRDRAAMRQVVRHYTEGTPIRSGTKASEIRDIIESDVASEIGSEGSFLVDASKKSARSRAQREVLTPAQQQSHKETRAAIEQAIGPEAQLLSTKDIDSYNRVIKNNYSSTQEAFDAVLASEYNTVPPFVKANMATLAEQVRPAAKEFKDLSTLKVSFQDVYRNFEQVFPDEQYQIIKKKILDPFDEAKGARIDTVQKLSNDLDENVVSKFGFKKGSKESAAVMDYGEGVKKYDDLVKEFGQKKADDIVESDAWFRKMYDEKLEEWNAVMAKIYPGKPDKMIPRRENYYRHFQEMSGLTGLKNIFETPTGIDPRLGGISEFTKPKTKFASAAQRRLGIKSKRDAVGGYLEYIEQFSYAKHIDEHIQVFRGFNKEIADVAFDEGVKLDNFTGFLQDFANDLAGKTNPLDRFLQNKVFGRKAFQILNWMNSRVKANLILGKISSSIAQFGNIPNGIASAKQYSAIGMKRTLASIFEKNVPMSKSTFIKERYADSLFDKFDTGILASTKKAAIWVTGIGDEIGTKFIWNAHYEKALAKNIDNPIKWADDQTRKLVAGRGIGEVPIIQKSKTFQLVAPFQIEVANAWWVIQGFAKKKDIGALMTLFVASHLFNKAAEGIRGSGVVFDPIDSFRDGVQILIEDENKATGVAKFFGRQFGEVLSNIPFGQTIAAAAPDTITIGGIPLDKRDLYGEQDPTRFGGGLLVTKSIQDPIFKLVTPYGGSQIRNTKEGLQAFINGEVRTKKGDKAFDLDQNPMTLIKSILFGKYATNEAQEYFDQRSDLFVKVDLQEQKRNEVAIDAEAVFKKIKKTSDVNERFAIIQSIQNSEPAVYKKLTDIIEQEALGYTTNDRLIKMLGVENGERARFIADELDKIKNEDKRTEFLTDLSTKGLLNERTLEQIYVIRKNGGEKTASVVEDDRTFIQSIGVHAKAFTTDPITAFRYVKTGQKIRRVDSGAIIVERLPFSESQAIRSARGADEYVELDHIIPLQLGGSNNEDNLTLLPVEKHREKTEVDNYLGRKLRDGLIRKKEAQALIIDYVEGRKTFSEIKRQIES